MGAALRTAPRLIDSHLRREKQVLAPTRNKGATTTIFNARLQEILNPADVRKPELRRGYGGVLRMGDRVIQVANNYEKEVFNGMMVRDPRMSAVYGAANARSGRLLHPAQSRACLLGPMCVSRLRRGESRTCTCQRRRCVKTTRELLLLTQPLPAWYLVTPFAMHPARDRKSPSRLMLSAHLPVFDHPFASFSHSPQRRRAEEDLDPPYVIVEFDDAAERRHKYTAGARGCRCACKRASSAAPEPRTPLSLHFFFTFSSDALSRRGDGGAGARVGGDGAQGAGRGVPLRAAVSRQLCVIAAAAKAANFPQQDTLAVTFRCTRAPATLT